MAARKRTIPLVSPPQPARSTAVASSVARPHRAGVPQATGAPLRCGLHADRPILALVALAARSPPPPTPTRRRPASKWTQAYITEADGTKLHADVLRPAHLPANAKTPVILSIGPYFNHSGQTGPLGPVQGTPYTPTGEAGPSARFYDFINGAKLMERGYTWVQVDLRGFGGSTGCLDWAGPGEQADVKAAVEWAAKQPWSTGKVGMYGKSYDGVTGLIGIAQQPQGLAAVVAQEPVYDLYRYLYSNRVRFMNSLAHAAALRRDRRHAGHRPATRSPTTSTRSTTRARLPGAELARPAERRPRRRLLARPRPDRRDARARRPRCS